MGFFQGTEKRGCLLAERNAESRERKSGDLAQTNRNFVPKKEELT